MQRQVAIDGAYAVHRSSDECVSLKADSEGVKIG
jgi:hypothetical protein